MNKYICVLLLLLSNTMAYSQNMLNAIIKDSETKEPLIGATASINGTTIGAGSNAKGEINLAGIPNGQQVIRYSYVGYEDRLDTLTFPLAQQTPIIVLLQHEGEELEEVVISTTRSSRTIDDIPTRIEAITLEELGEKGNMKPGDIRMLLSESTGIQTQQTSATSANANIRIQGLGGRYTQIIQDGFPLYSGFSSGLSIMQIPPLNLYQVEVIKGSSSTLYGGGAIAGLVNLITKKPTEEGELSFMANVTSASGLDLSSFYGKRFGKLGVTVFAARNTNEAYDPADIGFSAIPEFERYTVNPRLYYYPNERTQLYFGVNTTQEDRLGGDLRYIDGSEESYYFEQNKTKRFSTQFNFEHKLSDQAMIYVKNSVSFFNREIAVPDYDFEGKQTSSFSEVAYSLNRGRSDWVIGANLWTDKFSEQNVGAMGARDYDNTIVGAFAQNTFTPVDWLVLETGLRTDYVSPSPENESKGLFVLPRVSALFRISDRLSSRIGGGMGYKTPTIFTQEAENITFRNILPLNANETEAESSIGGNADINYSTIIGDKVTFSINQMFFYTYLNNPLILTLRPDNLYEFQNANGYVDTKGVEANIKFGYEWVKLFLGYTYTDARQHYNGIVTDMPLTSKHRVNNVLMLEKEDNFRIGLEAYYFSPQRLSDGSKGRDYWISGIMMEKMFPKFSLFLNFENIFDTRQSRFDSIYTGSRTNPVFNEIYAPVDGRVINGGIKLNLL
ncbi:TonB-dependent receptor domain-containing protein [Pontibacter silvestris]|uniref:TonB-dependent receptor domain-containing protein n=1 Tax=Pontibacter silvestris TaxID=2305183 RepID=A0ABW4X3M0_9BACT|nr:TonB-dependent receptor [Pontibacter silvestris]MCC9135103.1 TonB-dependent receptor [Pontibacter silvestris]